MRRTLGRIEDGLINIPELLHLLFRTQHSFADYAENRLDANDFYIIRSAY